MSSSKGIVKRLVHRARFLAFKRPQRKQRPGKPLGSFAFFCLMNERKDEDSEFNQGSLKIEAGAQSHNGRGVQTHLRRLDDLEV